MFLPRLLLGGNPIAGAAGGVALCAVAASAAYTMRRKIPHPTEFDCIGCCFLRGGCHKHPKFNLIVEAHEAGNIPNGSPVYIYIECGRFDRQSQPNPVDKSTLEVPLFERLNIHVRQRDEILRVSLWRTGTISSSLLGELELNILDEIINNNYPQLTWYTLKKDGKTTVKVRLSFHRLDTELDSNISPLIQYAIIHATRQAALQNKPFTTSFDELDDKSKLQFLSCVLEGPLKLMGFTGWKEYYFKAIEGDQQRWQWVYWNNKNDMIKKKKPKGCVPLLAISLVLPDSHNRQQFYVKYHTKNGPCDLFLSRVDRDRDLWSDGLYEFLERLRAYLIEQTNEVKVESSKETLNETSEELNKNTLEKTDDTKQKIKINRRFVIDPVRSQTSNTSPNQIKKELPVSVAKMISEAMEGYDKEEPVICSSQNFTSNITNDYPLLQSQSTGGPL